MKLSLEHLDPRNHSLVCGLRNEFNEIIADFYYNSGKQNRFVPYRVCDYPAPVNPGDLGEFLIDGEWKVCEFAVKGGEWWVEANRIGCGATTKPSEESIAKMRKPKSETHRQNMRKPKSEIHRKNMSGERNNQFGKKGELSPSFGRTNTSEHNQKISASKTGKSQYIHVESGKRVYRDVHPGEGWIKGWKLPEG
jgi:hypothetical protein